MIIPLGYNYFKMKIHSPISEIESIENNYNTKNSLNKNDNAMTNCFDQLAILPIIDGGKNHF
jgi:hypothetical protein